VEVPRGAGATATPFRSATTERHSSQERAAADPDYQRSSSV
jgi:hypothetical protein